MSSSVRREVKQVKPNPDLEIINAGNFAGVRRPDCVLVQELREGSKVSIEAAAATASTRSTSKASARRARPISSNSNSAQSSRPPSASVHVKETSLRSVKRKDESSLDRDANLLKALSLDSNNSDDRELVDMCSLQSPSLVQSSEATASGTVTLSGMETQESGVETQESEGDDSEEESTSDDDCEMEERKAPSELILEFLQCVMAKDMENALKLCRMILIYEPNHPEARSFLPLLQQKKDQDEAEEESEEDNSGDESDDDDNENSEEDSAEVTSSESEESAPENDHKNTSSLVNGDH